MMNDPKDPFQATRGKIFLWGAALTAVLTGLVYLYVPKAPRDAVADAPLQGPGSESALLQGGELQPGSQGQDGQQGAQGAPPVAEGNTGSADGAAGAQTPAAAAAPEGSPESNYAKYCAQCHGPAGNGDGPMARMMSQKPSNLVSGPYKYARTEEGVSALILNGIGSMPNFKKELGEEKARELARYVLSLEAKTPAP